MSVACVSTNASCLVLVVRSFSPCLQLFYSFFKSLVGKEVIVELKNDLWYVQRYRCCEMHCVSRINIIDTDNVR